MTYPELYCCVKVILKNGAQTEAYWNGTSWTEELPDSSDSRFLDESDIESWEMVT